MNVINRFAVRLAPALAVASLCRGAFALENTGPTDTGSDSTTLAVTSQPKQDSVKKEEEPKQGSRRTDHFRIGVLGGVGFPRPLELEGMVKIENLVGLGVEYSLLPNLSVSGVDTTFWALAADVRLFPFHNAFFVGFKAGRQHLGGDAMVTVPPYGSVHEAVSVGTTFINPRLGFLWTWDPGVTLGLDIGVQIPLSATSSSSLPVTGTTIDSDVTRVTNSLGKYALPTIDLLRLGVLL